MADIPVVDYAELGRVLAIVAWRLDGLEPWRRDALCREPAYSMGLFFPRSGQRPDAARRVCARCLVRVECAAYAAREGVEAGVWGGMLPAERRTATAPAA